MIFFYRIVNKLAPKYLTDIIPTTNNRRYSTRSQTQKSISSTPELKVLKTLFFVIASRNGINWVSI